MKNLILFVMAMGIIGYFQAQSSLTYHFNGDFNEASGLGPPLIPVGTGSGTFVTEPSLGGDGAYQFTFDHGVMYNNTAAGNFLGATYSIEMLFRYDNISGWKKFIDYKNRLTDDGHYNLSGSIYYYPITGSGDYTNFSNGEYSRFIVTRDDATKEFKMYLNCEVAASFYDTGNLAVMSAANVLHFMIDDFATGRSEHAPGAIAFLRMYDYVIPESVIGASLDDGTCSVDGGGPGGGGTSDIPTLSEWGMITLFLLIANTCAIAVYRDQRRKKLA